MSLLKNPNEIDDAVILNGIIYGQPGVGKSTLALSMPKPVMIDADMGMARVEKRFQVPSLPLNQYKDVLALLDSPEIDPFDTIVIDTLGKFIDRMGDQLIKDNPKNRQTSSSALSMQGWGAVKQEFQSFLRKAKAKGKHLVFVAHEREEKDGDIKTVRPDVSGSSGKDLVKELNFMGYMQMRGGQYTISFTPDERFYAKNSLGLPPIIEVPDPNKVGNDFMAKRVLARAIERHQESDNENQKYLGIIKANDAHVKAVTDAETALAALNAIDKAEVMWDSQRVAKKRLLDMTKSLGLTFDKEKKIFVAAPKAEKSEGEKKAEKPKETKEKANKKAAAKKDEDETLPGDGGDEAEAA